jgi:glutathione synthase/RimK-type ligase-like ATP-grasp enzyme
VPAIVVIENPKNWDLDMPGIEVVAARDYLTDPRFSESRRVRVFNFCRRYGYQSLGYYVSLLAEARGHRPLPSVAAMQDLRLSPVIRIASEDLDDVLQKSLKGLKADTFSLSVYFGRNLARRYDSLSKALYNYFPVPFLRAEFERTDRWRLERIQPIASSEIPQSHRPFVNAQARRHLDRPPPTDTHDRDWRYDLAILVNPTESHRPSNDRAIRHFLRAARSLGIAPTLIDKDDLGRLAEFDALFIRETTGVNHYTYRFARKAEAEGLEVMDDARSIVRCSNKVYLEEVFTRHRIPRPRTLILHEEGAADRAAALGFPVILKRPDSSFSRGVVKAMDRAELDRLLAELFEESDLVLAQEWIASEFDWRIGVLDGRALWACKYYMAPGHWQIETTDEDGRVYGEVETLPLEEVPTALVWLSERAAGLIGRGLYGLDVKQAGDRFLVMEINDNPNIDGGFEDRVLKDEIYLAVMRTFLERLERRGRGKDAR